jgi:hypothetical protein
MSYDGTPDAVFNPGDDPLAFTPYLFTEPEPERGYNASLGNPRLESPANGHFEGAMAQRELDLTLEGDSRFYDVAIFSTS